MSPTDPTLRDAAERKRLRECLLVCAQCDGQFHRDVDAGDVSDALSESAPAPPEPPR